MQTDEAYVFVNYDSRRDGRPRFTPHAAIVDSSVPADAPIRESVETRALVFWDWIAFPDRTDVYNYCVMYNSLNVSLYS